MSPDSRLDVVGIGNAIVDVLTRSDDAELARLGLNKGVMTLIDQARAESLYEQMADRKEASGGSAANTLAGVAALGGSAGYIGKVNDDPLGESFRRDMHSIGVRFDTAPLEGGTPTARCLIFVSPDAQRTMQTYLGASVEIGVEDVDADLIRAARVVYLEGYLWDRPAAKEAFLRAAALAHEAGAKVSLTLSDPFCVDRHRDSFRDLVANHVDLLFGNEEEIVSLYQTGGFDSAITEVARDCETAALTRGSAGSVIVHAGKTLAIPAAPVARVVDTTGAGDLYAAGFLYGYARELPLTACGRIASACAAEIISHFGARPESDLGTLTGPDAG